MVGQKDGGDSICVPQGGTLQLRSLKLLFSVVEIRGLFVSAISSVLAERLWLFHGTGQDERNSAHQTSQSFRCVMRGTCSLWTWRTFPFQVSYSTGHPMCAVCLFICFYVDNLAGCHVSVSHLHQKVPSRTWCSLPIPIRPARRLEPAREGGSGCGE